MLNMHQPLLLFGTEQKAAEKPIQSKQSSLQPPRKTVAVVDCFDRNHVDIDGDKIPDMSHGEVICRLIKALAPQLQIEKYFVESGYRLKEPDTYSLIKALNLLLTHIRSGKKIDAVNLSLSHEGSRRYLSEHYNQPHVKRALLTSPHPEDRLFGQRFQVLENIAGEETPVYSGAGNESPELYNLYGAAEGVSLVAHTNAEGLPVNHKDFNDPLIDHFVQGQYAVTQLEDGFDLNGDDVADIYNHEVSGEGKAVSIVSPFNGQPLDEKLGTKEDIITLLKRGGNYVTDSNVSEEEMTPKYMEKLHAHIAEHPLARTKVYKLEDLNEFGLLNDSGLAFWSNYGDYALYPAYQKEVVFRLDENGTLQFNPDNSGLKNIVKTISGSSYATPTALVRDLS